MYFLSLCAFTEPLCHTFYFIFILLLVASVYIMSQIWLGAGFAGSRVQQSKMLVRLEHEFCHSRSVLKVILMTLRLGGVLSGREWYYVKRLFGYLQVGKVFPANFAPPGLLSLVQ